MVSYKFIRDFFLFSVGRAMSKHDARLELLKAIREARMDISPFIASPSRLKVLKAIYEHENGIHIRALMRAVGCDQRTLYKVIRALEAEGLLVSKRFKHKRGRPRFIKLNRNHPKFRVIKALVESGSLELIEALFRFGERIAR